jgi:hypothetical protein
MSPDRRKRGPRLPQRREPAAVAEPHDDTTAKQAAAPDAEAHDKAGGVNERF